MYIKNSMVTLTTKKTSIPDVGKRFSIPVRLLVMELLNVLAIVLLTVLDFGSIVSILFSLSFILELLLLLFDFKSFSKNAFLLLALVIYCFASIIFSFLRSGGSFSISYFISFFTLLSTVIFIKIMTYFDPGKSLVTVVLVLTIIYASIFPFAYFVLNIKTQMSYWLSMNFGNPNMLGWALAPAVMFSIIGFLLIKNRIVKLLCIILTIVDSFLLLQTDARNSILAVFVFFIFLVIIIFKKKKFSKKTLFVASIFPTLFFVTYMLLIHDIGSNGILDFLVDNGKGLDSRFSFWNTRIELMDPVSWIFGDFSKFRGNMHNTHFTVLCSYGLIGLALFSGFLFDCMNRVNECIKNKKQMVCLAGFFCVILLGNGEGALIYGSIGIFMYACLFLLFARYEWM